MNYVAKNVYGGPMVDEVVFPPRKGPPIGSPGPHSSEESDHLFSYPFLTQFHEEEKAVNC